MLDRFKQTIHHKRLVKSFLFALKGLIHIIKYHHNAQLIFFFALLVIGVSMYLEISIAERLIVLLTIGMVFICEIFNTMVEEITDIITDKKFHPQVEIIKDMAAGSVLVACIISLIVGYFVFIKRIFYYT